MKDDVLFELLITQKASDVIKRGDTQFTDLLEYTEWQNGECSYDDLHRIVCDVIREAWIKEIQTGDEYDRP